MMLASDVLLGYFLLIVTDINPYSTGEVHSVVRPFVLGAWNLLPDDIHDLSFSSDSFR